VVFYECLFGKLPWSANSIPMLVKNINNKKLEFPKSISDETKDLIQKMLTVKEEDRADWKVIAEHAALKKVKLPSEVKK